MTVPLRCRPTGAARIRLPACARTPSSPSPGPALGADGVELDVRLTADGGLAIHHDPVIDGVGAIHELAATNLPGHVPLLADALAACAGMVVNIEVKNLPDRAGVRPVRSVAAGRGRAGGGGGGDGSVVVSSFWAGALTAVPAPARALRPGCW